ncbi:hypothetical protein EVAR_22877_1 [Eumeta japonica]|uniref:Uncharacterized protein n=1 Tax=Eumeta variegata TaxID=151549 RepID=A0A4C1UVD4_EUMVA|nr:hypothetical protein EVAR_22877_1 [Eumeta japonica]
MNLFLYVSGRNIVAATLVGDAAPLPPFRGPPRGLRSPRIGLSLRSKGRPDDRPTRCVVESKFRLTTPENAYATSDALVRAGRAGRAARDSGSLSVRCVPVES